jgi:arabinoxylan arabinofuranohydrolase
MPVEIPLITEGMTMGSRRPNADINPAVFIDDDGTACLAWGNGDCYLAKLKPNMIELDGPIKKLDITPYYSEGPWIFKRGDLYKAAKLLDRSIEKITLLGSNEEIRWS